MLFIWGGLFIWDFYFSQLFPFHVIGCFDIKQCRYFVMLHDMGENTIKELLEELKMLGVSVSGSGDDNEKILGGGKTTVQLSAPVDGDRDVDVSEYIILYAWTEYTGAHRKNDLHFYELRYYKSDKSVHYIEDGNDKGAEGKEHREYWRAEHRFTEIKYRTYEVTQQKVKFDPKPEIEEVRRYKDGTEALWQLQHTRWRDITPT